jgi:putative pyruvate formate lyase activating enzyme
MSVYRHCLLCPRRCGVDREAGQRGYCGETAALRIAFAGIHCGEEPSVTGAKGSGTIFVSGCNLGCAFCQNHQISHNGLRSGGEVFQALGRAVETEEFAGICLALRDKGAENINIVTGSHAAPAIARGVKAARKQGLDIPVLWNSSGYEGPETLEILRGFVDVYLPDLKTMDPNFAARFFDAPDYPEYAAAAILKMMEYRELRFGSRRGGPAYATPAPFRGEVQIASLSDIMVQETLVSGVIVRHLIIPGFLDATRQILSWFSGNRTGGALLSLMTQYTPVYAPGIVDKAGIPGRYLSKGEYEKILSIVDGFGIEDGFCQELVTDSEWLPDFTRPNPFSSELSVPVWHYFSNPYSYMPIMV